MLLLFGVFVFFGLFVVGFECCVFVFIGMGFCFVLVIFSGVKSNFVDGEGGFIFIGFSGVGL